MTTPFFAELEYGADGALAFIGSTEELEALLGYEPSELCGKGLEDITVSDDAETSVPAAACGEGQSTERILTLRKKDGAHIRVIERSVCRADRNGNVTFKGVFLEAGAIISRFNEMQAELEEQRKRLSKTENAVISLRRRAEQDSLTGLLNASTTRHLSEEYLGEPELNCAMLVIDFDDFKSINDRYGHLMGDKILVAMSATVKKLFRSNDVVGRIGGDELLVLMKDVATPEIVGTRCAQIVEAFNSAACEPIAKGTVTCSVGAVFSTRRSSSYDDLFSLADEAMYSVKQRGGNGYTVECAD